MSDTYFPSRANREKQYTPDAMERYREVDRLEGIVSSSVALQPTQSLPGSPMKIVILARRYEYGGIRFAEGLCLDEDYNDRD